MFDDVAVAPAPHLSGLLSVPASPPCWHGGRHCQLRADLLLPLHGLPGREDPGGGGERERSEPDQRLLAARPVLLPLLQVPVRPRAAAGGHRQRGGELRLAEDSLPGAGHLPVPPGLQQGLLCL